MGLPEEACARPVHNPTMSDTTWLVAVVHCSARSEVMFTAEFPTLPPSGTLLSWPNFESDPKFVVVRAYVEVPKAKFPLCRRAYLEVREISLDTDFPSEFPGNG